MLFGLVEYWEMALVMEVASVGLVWKRSRSGKGERPEVKVRMRVFIGLTKHPSGAPILANWSQTNFKSSSRMQAEMSSTYPRRWVMPPKPSSPRSPFWRRVAALSRSSMSSGWRSLATTSEAKMGESWQPWLPLSSIRRVHDLP